MQVLEQKTRKDCRTLEINEINCKRFKTVDIRISWKRIAFPVSNHLQTAISSQFNATNQKKTLKTRDLSYNYPRKTEISEQELQSGSRNPRKQLNREKTQTIKPQFYLDRKFSFTTAINKGGIADLGRYCWENPRKWIDQVADVEIYSFDKIFLLGDCG